MVIANIGGVGRLGLTRRTGEPPWALAAHLVDGVRPGFFIDVLNSRYALGGAARSLADLLTVTNASAIRTYIDQSGVMQTAAANTPRIDWSSGGRELLLEGAATNYAIRSEDFAHSAWNTNSGVPIITGGETAPTGATTAQLFTVGASGFQFRYQSFGGMTSGVATAVSIWARTQSGTYSFRLRAHNASSTNVYVSPVLTATTTWQRFSFAFTPSATEALNIGLDFRPGVVSGATGAGACIFWGAQVELGSVATSYIPTTGSAVTRTADLCQLSASAAAVLQGAGAAMAFRGGAPVIPSTSQPLIGGPTTSRLLYLPSSGSGIPYMDNSIGHALGVTETSPLDIRAAFGWGGSGQRGASWGGPARADARILGVAVSSLWLGGNSGLLSGQIIRVRQIVGWSLPDRPSAAGVQAQARAAS